MRYILFIAVLLFVCKLAYSEPIVLLDSTGTAVGTVSNPLIVTTTGTAGFSGIDITGSLTMDGTGTTAIRIDGANGGCLMIRDTDDAGWTQCDVLDGTMTCATDADGICN